MEAGKTLSALKAIRAKCLDCSGGRATEVRLCPIKDCAVYPYRFGQNPNRTPRVLTEEQKAKLVERLQRAREKRLLTE